jgi:hypothetical protein
MIAAIGVGIKLGRITPSIDRSLQFRFDAAVQNEVSAGCAVAQFGATQQEGSA